MPSELTSNSTLPALTIRQPWATALVHPDLPKTIETRSRRLPAKYLGVDVAVVAGRYEPDYSQEVDNWWCYPEKDQEWPARRLPGGRPDGHGLRWEARCASRASLRRIALPLGAIVGTVRFVECLPVRWVDDRSADDATTRAAWVEHANGWPTDMQIGSGNGPHGDYVECHRDLPWGDYRPGRWAWITDPAHSRLFDEPIAACGALHWQMVEVPS